MTDIAVVDSVLGDLFARWRSRTGGRLPSASCGRISL